MASSSACEFPRCSNAAEYSFPDEPGVARFCGAHKEDAMVPAAVCQFPRCSEAPTYGFADEGPVVVARFCEKHRSDDMVHAVSGGAFGAGGSGDAHVKKVAPTPAAAANGGKKKPPSEASLELAYKYFEIKPEYDSLENVESQAKEHKAILDKLRANIKHESFDIHQLSKGIEKLEKQLQRQDKKLINLGGKSPFGKGILMKDNKVVEKIQNKKAVNEEKLHDLEGRKEKDESHLASMMEEQAKLNDLVETRKALEARIQDLREQCLEEEGTSSLRRVQSKLRDNDRMATSLKNCRQDVAKADKIFREALAVQAHAVRSNAMAVGANLGQAIGGGGGRGIGNSPGERLMQIRRNQATKKSILMAKEASDIFNTAQKRLDKDLRVAYPKEMAGVGNVEVPNLWHGEFFRDFLVGQVAGNIGDAINEARAMRMIRKNMQELEIIISVCDEQGKKLSIVYDKLMTVGGALEHEVKKQEKEILNYVIATAKEAQAGQVKA